MVLSSFSVYQEAVDSMADADIAFREVLSTRSAHSLYFETVRTMVPAAGVELVST
jgi:hypothetical protein